MNRIPPRRPERLREQPAEPPGRSREQPAEPSRTEVLRHLEQSAFLLDHVLDRTKQAGSGLLLDEQRALAKDLSIISSVLRFLGENVIPSLLADESARGALWREAAWGKLNRMGRMTAELELCLNASPSTLN